jgi:hypothetical protein
MSKGNCLYQIQIKTEQTSDISGNACHQLYMLCDRFDMPQLKNVAMDQYRKGLNEAALVPDADEIDDIYRRSPLGSPFRRLMTRIAARQIMDPDNSEFDYRSQDMLEQAQQLQSMSESTNMQLIWIAGISLLVGGIGVMNIMLVSVTERTAEIGLKKAIGAKKKRILLQFLTEAAVLTSLGGIIGVVSGIGLAQLISSMMQIPVAIDVAAIAVSVVFSMLIGVIFGLLPAIKAANLNPIDALRRV